jgi:sugar (pentulose or hexulose) kinase
VTTAPGLARSVFPRLPSPTDLSIGIDIGGTKVAAGVVDENGAILERLLESTPSHSP